MSQNSVLIADDDPGVRDLLKELLHEEGYRLFFASNGREAVEIATRQPIDVAILDLRMPVMGGVEALKEIKKIDETVQVLMITGFADMDSLSECVSEGALDYIPKPVHLQEITRAVRRAVLRRQIRNGLLQNRLKEKLVELEEEFGNRTRQLREIQVKYKEIVESSNDIIVVVQDERLKFANRRLVEATGYTVEEACTIPFLGLVHPEDRPSLSDKYQAWSRGDLLKDTLVLRGLKKDGGFDWFEMNAATTSWEGRPAILGVLRDINDRKRAEEKLRWLTDQFETVFNTMAEGVLVVDTESKVTFVNNSALRALGYEGEDLVGRGVREVVFGPWASGQPGSDDPCGIREALQGRGPQGPSSSVFRRRDGSDFPVECMCTVVQEKGRPVRAIVTFRDITERKAWEDQLKRSLENLRMALGGIIRTLSAAVEMRDPYTAGHQRRVTNLARCIAQRMGLSRDQIEAIRFAGMVHDVGKISLPAEILSKPSRLSDLEFNLIKTHPQAAYSILREIEFPWPIAQIVLQHHERMDGSGYPNGLTGEEILVEARVLAVADVVEAMASHRPYRPSLSLEDALREISSRSGTLYDPRVVEACLKVFSEERFNFG